MIYSYLRQAVDLLPELAPCHRHVAHRANGAVPDSAPRHPPCQRFGVAEFEDVGQSWGSEFEEDLRSHESATPHPWHGDIFELVYVAPLVRGTPWCGPGGTEVTAARRAKGTP